jgi:hypothetical protein
VNEFENLVLIHFDGWGQNFDYWAKLSDEDLLPAGNFIFNHLNNIFIKLFILRVLVIYIKKTFITSKHD